MTAESRGIRIAYSYARYSSPEQGAGDSERRQTELALEWCKRNDARLDKTRTFLDRGRSAYKGKHRESGSALKAFLDDVEGGYIPAGSVLIIENLDRLSREEPWSAMSLLTSIVNLGITIVALQPREMVYERNPDTTPIALIQAVMEFCRGHSESSIKESRALESWEQKRKLARERGTPATRSLPGWVGWHGGRLRLIPDRARVVRRIFDLTIRGYGLTSLVRLLTEEKVPTWGGAEKGWSKAYVHKILSRRTVLGECQFTRSRKPVGEPVRDYYPAVIDEETWYKAQAALASRIDKPGRVGEKVATLFGGLLRDAATGDRLYIGWQTGGRKTGAGTREKRRILVNARSTQGAIPAISFPYGIFEEALLRLLKELNPADLLPGQSEGESVIVAADLATREARLAAIEAELAGDTGDVPMLARVARKIDDDCKALRARLAEIRVREANPQAVAWAEAGSLFDAAKDETTRFRLRALLRTIIKEAWILIVPRRSYRLCAVQIFFQGDGRRDYLILYRSAGNCRQSFWCAKSLSRELSAGKLDLRNREDADALTTTLREIDLSLLSTAMGV